MNVLLFEVDGLKGTSGTLPYVCCATFLCGLLSKWQHSFFLKLFIHEIPSAYKKIKFYQLYYIKQKYKILRANRIADLPGSRVLTGFQLIKYVFSCFLNWHKAGSSQILIGISFQTLRAE